MPAVSSIALAIGTAGLATQAASAVGQFGASQRATAASLRAERSREEQMRAESMRRQRESIRQSLIANSLARSRNVNQGAGLGSSTLFGAYGQTQGEMGRQLAYTAENERIGGDIFSANRDLARAQGDVQTFQGLGKFGEALTTQAMPLAKIGSSLFGGPNPYNPIGISSGKAPRYFYSSTGGD